MLVAGFFAIAFLLASTAAKNSDGGDARSDATEFAFGERVFSESDLLLFARRTDKHQPAAFLRQSAIVEIMSLNLNPLYDTKVTPAGEVPVFGIRRPYSDSSEQ